MSDIQVLLEQLADTGPVVGAGPVFDGATRQAATRRRIRRRRRVLSSCAAVVAAVVVIGAVVQSQAVHEVDVGPRVGGSAPPPPEVTTAQLAAGHWAVVPAAPIAPRDYALVVWTGKELVVWGGQAASVSTPPGGQGGFAFAPFLSDGAAYNPATSTWRKLPAAPITAAVGEAAVWTGSEMIVWGADGGKGAAYSPSRDIWRRVPTAPLQPSPYALGVWTGDRAMFFSGASAAAYEPATNRWSRLLGAELGASASLQLVAAAGPGRVLAWYVTETRAQIAQNTLGAVGTSALFRYDERTDRWTELPSSPNAILQPEQAIWTGDRLLVRGDMHEPGAAGPGPLPEVSAWYDPDTGVATLLPADALTANNIPAGGFSSTWTGRALVSLNAQGQAGPIVPGDASVYDATANTWRRLPSAPFGCGGAPVAGPVWSGSVVLLYCSEPNPKQPHPVGGLAFLPAAASG